MISLEKSENNHEMVSRTALIKKKGIKILVKIAKITNKGAIQS